ncbi:MAG: tyrosine-type recombinase/integrase [Rhodospirillaceae bacterium]|nr:tyrosine-type recombinase/integrase [Rhodospirillaceae bacterium]
MASVRKRSWKTAQGDWKSAWAVDFVDQLGERHRRQFGTKREADAFRVEIEGQLRGGSFRAEAMSATVKDACEGFLEHCTGRRDRGERMTRHNLLVYEGHVWNYICPDPARTEKRKGASRVTSFAGGIGAVKLAQLTTGVVSDFRDRLRDAGVSVPTARKILATLHGVLEHAKSRDLIAINPVHGVKVIGRRDEGSKKIIPPTKAALRALIDVAGSNTRVKLIVAAATGLRAGEFHALRWRHLDFTAGEVTIETRVDAYGDEDMTKTKAGMRTIPVGQPVLTALKEVRLRSLFKKPDDLVFPNRDGSYENHDNFIKREFLPLFEKLEKDRAEDETKSEIARFNWHALRHFAVSTWIEAGLSPKTIQTYAGHSSLQVTMDRYGHLFKSEDQKKAMDAIAQALLGS